MLGSKATEECKAVVVMLALMDVVNVLRYVSAPTFDHVHFVD
jgi:hypothetical protein